MVSDEDKKPAAPPPSSTSSPSKRRKTMEDIYDVADQLGFRSGDRFEVKWIIRDEDDDHGIEGAAVGSNHEEVAADDDDAGGITVWWSASLIRKTDRMHTLTGEDMTEGESVPVVKVPIYELEYKPMQEHGFDTYSVEEVVFTSDKTVLNLSTDEIMTFRRAGQPSPPSSPGPEELETDATMAAAAEIVGVGCTQDEMITVINDIMQRSLKNTGMDQRMKSLPASQQLMMAEKLRQSQELMLEKLLEETDKMKGEKIITEDVVRKCIAQMNA